ncbi:hypothetical protein [Yoonia litorea]|uniref:Uncharacterized protein n=1 Tax=Yoonia litorea TaxID=1123755 RepID=A0A1I6LYU9_9RHOB|nr:hypothetical protein [Yoonia litorea]SFS08585.1 hypothetical protein SAMN05444714_1034 [Yoonia litorea]
MWHRISDIWAHHKLGVVVLICVLCLTGVFGVRTASQIIYWSNPAKLEQPLQDWMTPRYVARSYEVPPAVVLEALGLTGGGVPRRASLETLALETGLTLEQMQMRVDAAVASYRADRS